jgi:S-layer homology domain
MHGKMVLVSVVLTAGLSGGGYALEAVRPPSTFGTANATFQVLGPPEFNPNTQFPGYGRADFLTTTLPGARFSATPHLPAGALLTYAEFDYCDSNEADHHMTFSILDNQNVGIHSSTTLFQGDSVSNPAEPCASLVVDLSSVGYAVDNLGHRLRVEIFFASGDSTHMFLAGILGYTLQVSPPPATATFNDVPTNDAGFQYIEALAASGITGGCGGGNYCPDNPVTRRQMAVFLAKALGLHWPD